MINLAHVDITRISWYQEGREHGILFGKEIGKLESKRGDSRQLNQQKTPLVLLGVVFCRFKTKRNKGNEKSRILLRSAHATSQVMCRLFRQRVCGNGFLYLVKNGANN